MPIRRLFNLVISVCLPLLLLTTSCGERRVCEGLNQRTGSANNSRNARKGNRGGYKSPRELEARDRQRSRLKNRSKQSARKSHGGGNTTGRGRGFSSRGGFDINIGGSGKVQGSGSVKF
jgi:hypothetical protein